MLWVWVIIGLAVLVGLLLWWNSKKKGVNEEEMTAAPQAPQEPEAPSMPQAPPMPETPSMPETPAAPEPPVESPPMESPAEETPSAPSSEEERPM